MPPRKAAQGPTPVEAITHADKRANLPTADAQDFVTTEIESPFTFSYPRPLYTPQLVWRGKEELDRAETLDGNAPPIYIQEKIDPRVLVENLRRTAARPADEPELTLFDSFDGLPELDLVEFYRHQANWSNRMILGDSLGVMASLAEREALRGKVQMIYIDPPYGIKFNSNWQVSARKRDVKDGRMEDATREVEQIKAFRDTWEYGINSYLTYLRDRLTVAKELLTDSGSCFVQIGDENVHLVRSLMDEVFGSENFVTTITVSKTTSATGAYLGGTVDSVHWYAREARRLKYRPLHLRKVGGGTGSAMYRYAEELDGTRRTATSAEHSGSVSPSVRLYRRSDMTSQSAGRAKGEGAASWFPVTIDGRIYRPSMQARWKTNQLGMSRLFAAGRLEPAGASLNYVRYMQDFPAVPISEVWLDLGGASDKVFVVQTNPRIIERCMLMTTDPGDLVLDPTCGSGTTAYVAEQWGGGGSPSIPPASRWPWPASGSWARDSRTSCWPTHRRAEPRRARSRARRCRRQRRPTTSGTASSTNGSNTSP